MKAMGDGDDDDDVGAIMLTNTLRGIGHIVEYRKMLTFNLKNICMEILSHVCMCIYCMPGAFGSQKRMKDTEARITYGCE